MDPSSTFDHALRLHRQGKLREAYQHCAAILEADPRHAPAWHLSGVVTHESGDAVGAIERLRRSLQIDPAPALPWADLARALDDVGRPEAAVNALKEAVRRAPRDAALWSNLGVSEAALGRRADAERSVREGLAADPRYARGWYNLALMLETQGRVLEALDAASRALGLAPEEPAHAGLKAQLEADLGNAEAARRTLVTALARHPAVAPLRQQLAAAAEAVGDVSAAISAYDQVLRLQPGNGAALSALIFLKKRVCDWRDLPALQQQFRDGVKAARPWLTPFSFLSDPSTRAEQRACATLAAPSARAPATMARPPRSAGRLRIGYLSGDFFDHPTAVLTAGVFEAHDRSRVRVVAFSTGPDDGGALRRRIVAGVERFVDLAGAHPSAQAERIRAERIDILVDLKGHTSGPTLEILAARPAPIQVHWLGYPGTLGAPYVDHLIGDGVVTPLAHAADYAESLVQLPHSYQSNDRARVVTPPPSRASLGLPAGAAVFCCFNNSFKINAQVIDIWCSILKEVANSVLWLLARSEADPAIAHLRREVAARDVAPSRLIFATHRPQADYLGLYEHADLFLDTWPYNAHTTASDALWVGCPVVTFMGETFAGRVGASLLAAVGLPELVAADVAGYRALAIDLARDDSRRAALRDYLRGPGRASPLFDAAAFARHLESAFDAMARQYRDGRKAPIIIGGDPV